MKNNTLTMLALMLSLSVFSQVKDFDGNEYKTIKIGEQEWMAENLNVKHFRNGDLIPEARSAEDWQKANENKLPTWCYYNNDPINGEKYGKLYNFYAVIDPRGLAPIGWEVPNSAEWNKLVDQFGGQDFATNRIGFKSTTANKMKSTTGWNENGNGSNESQFSGLPGGLRSNYGEFRGIGLGSCYWNCQKRSGESQALALYLLINEVKMDNPRKGYGLSVRCIKQKSNNNQVENDQHFKQQPSFTQIIYENVDVQPSFSGDLSEIGSKVKEKFPEIPGGKIYLKVIVNTDGTAEVENVERGIQQEIDDYSVSVFNSTTGWKPALKNGQKVRCRMMIPVSLNK